MDGDVVAAQASDARRRFDAWAHASLIGVFFAFPVSLALANTLLASMLVFWLLAGRLKARWAVVRRNPITYPALAMYGLVLFGALYSTAPMSDIWTHVSKYSKFLLLLVAISLLEQKRWRTLAWQAFSVAMLLTLASAYANIWLDLPWSVTKNQGWGADHTVFKDKIAHGILTSFFVIVSIVRALRAPSPAARLVWGALVVLGLLSVTHLSGGRTGYLALGAGVVVFALAAAAPRLRAITLVGTVLAIGVLSVTSIQLQDRVSLAIAEAKNHNLEDFSSIGQRLYFWDRSAVLIKERPLMGWGTGAYHTEYCRIAATPKWCEHGKFHPHNQFLFWGVEYGLFGLLIFSCYLAQPVRVASRQSRRDMALTLAFMAIFVVDCMTHGALWLSTENHFFTFVLALLMAPASDVRTPEHRPFDSGAA